MEKAAKADDKPRSSGSLVDRLCQKDPLVDSATVLSAGFMKQSSMPLYNKKQKVLKKERRLEREKTKGAKWFDLPATEMTAERKSDLELLQMRSVLDRTRFYKKNDLKVLPKYFRIGRVVDSPADFYHARVPKKERKKTLVDELLADAEFRQYNKRKSAEIQYVGIKKKKKKQKRKHKK